MKFRIFVVWAAALVLLCGSGCLTYKQTIIFNADGSCLVSCFLSCPEEYAPLLESSLQHLGTTRALLGRGPALNYLDEAALRQAMAAEAIELRQYRRFRRDGVEHLQIIALARQSEAVFRSGLFGGFKRQAGAGGETSMVADIPAMPVSLGGERLQELRALCAGLDLTLMVVAPEPIVSGNGDLNDAKTMVWQWQVESDPAAPGLFRRSFPQIALTWKPN